MSIYRFALTSLFSDLTSTSSICSNLVYHMLAVLDDSCSQSRIISSTVFTADILMTSYRICAPRFRQTMIDFVEPDIVMDDYVVSPARTKSHDTTVSTQNDPD